MRLDHLLSKEQLARGRTSVPVRVHCFLVEHWLFIQPEREGAASTLSLRGVAERVHGTPGWMSTLLGPEEAGSARVFSCRPWPSPRGCGVAAVVLSVS